MVCAGLKEFCCKTVQSYHNVGQMSQ